MEKLQWTTTHNTANNTMDHQFNHGRIMICTDRNNGMIYIQKDGAAIDKIDGAEMSCDDYLELLTKTAREDERLSKFSVE